MRLRKALLLLIIPLNLFADTKTWQGTTSSMSTGSNWSPAGVPATNDDLVFPSAASNKTPNNDIGTLTVGTMTFSGGNYTLSGSPIVSSGAVNINQDSVTLSPSSPNQFTGVVNVGTISTQATLTAGSVGAIGSTSFQPSVTILGPMASPSKLDLNGNDNTLKTLSGNQYTSVTLGSATLTVTGASTNLPIYGPVSGTGNLVVPSGTFPLMAANTYSGTTTIQDGGTLNVLQGPGSTTSISFPSGAGTLVFGASGGPFNTPLSIAGTGNLSVNDYTVTLTGSFSGSGAWQKLGRGTLILQGTNNNTGPLTAAGGILNVNTASLGSPSSITFNTFGGTIQIAQNMTISQPITLSTPGGFDTNGFSLDLSGPISGGNPFTKAGAGTLTLTSLGNNYAAKTVIQDGTLSVTNQTFSPGSTQLVFDSPGTGILQITSDFAPFAPSIVLFDDGTIDTNGNQMTVTGAVAGLSTNAFNKNGAGTLTFTGQNVYQGPTNVNAGTLQAGIASNPTPPFGPFGLGSDVTVASGATLDFQNFQTTVGSLDNSGSTLSSDTVDATSYTQTSTGTLGLNFPTSQATPVGNISTTGAINLDGTLDVTSTGGFTLTSGEVILLQSSGVGKQLAGTFSTTNLPFGKLKYDYSQNQVILGVGGCDGIWGAAANGDWGLVGNWSSGCVPGVTGNTQDSATFNDVAAATVTATLADSAGTSALPVTLHDITFNAASTAFTIDQFDNTSVITLDGPSGSSKPTIHVTDGTPTIDAPILLNRDSMLSLSTGTLTLGSNTSIIGTQDLQIIEGNMSGTLTNNGSITPTSLTINGSTLNNNATVQTTGPIVIEDLSGLTNPINVNNSSTFTAGANLIIGGNATVTNSSSMTSGGNFTIRNGSVTNQSGGQLNAGLGNSLNISGGTLTNDPGGMLGSPNVNLSLTGGSLNSSNPVLANNYFQSGPGTLGLDFPTPSATPVGSILALAFIDLGGTLNVTNTGGYAPPTGTEVVLLQSAGTGSLLMGTFSSVNIASGLGILKYDYGQNQVYLSVGACDGTWNTTSSGEWGTVGNWVSCVPGISGNNQDSATFPELGAANVTVTLSTGGSAQPVTLHHIAFNSSSTNYTIQQFDNTTAITLAEPGGSSKPSIHLTGGSPTINAPIVLDADSVFQLSSGTLTLGSSTIITSNTTENLLISEGNTSGTLANNGAITPASLTIAGNTLNNIGSVQTSGPIVIQPAQGADPVVINNPSTFLAGTNLTIGGSTTIMNQSGAQMTAGSGGVFSITGGSITNSQGATFGGSDADLTFTGGTLNNSGTTRAKNYTQSGPATLQLNLFNTTNFGKVLVSDQANLGGNLIVNASSDPSLATNQTFDLITTVNGVSNTFSNVSFQGFSPSVIPDLVYLSNIVQLNTTPAVPGHFSGNQSHISVGMIKQHNSYIRRKCFQFRDRLPNGTAPANQNAISHIDLSNPEVKGTVASLDDPPSMNTTEQEEINPNLQPLPTGARSSRYGKVYIGPVASFGEIDTRKNQIGSTYTSVGGLIGADYLFSEIEKFPCDIGLGAILQYRRLWGHGKSSSGDYQSHILHGSIYTSFIPQALPGLSIEAILGYAHLWDHLNRKTGLNNKSTARSDSDQNLFDALLGLEYTFTLPKQFSFTPYLYLQYVYNHISDFKESGAGIYNLKVKSQSIDSLNTQLGARTCYNLIRKSYTLTFELDAEWIREYLHNDRSIGFTPFVITNQPTNVTAFGPSRNSLLLAVDLLLRFANGWQTEASYTFQYNSSFYDHFFYLGVGKRF